MGRPETAVEYKIEYRGVIPLVKDDIVLNRMLEKSGRPDFIKNFRGNVAKEIRSIEDAEICLTLHPAPHSRSGNAVSRARNGT
ncbi:MAG: hypothetical protein RO009_03085 [Pseudorhodoplanes sp.]|nr:hypothetical protein [Pseudorhodoplanes sp.]